MPEETDEKTQLYPRWTPACWRQTQMRLGLDSEEDGRSRTYSLAVHRAPLASTPERTRERSERVTCGKRC